MVQQRPTSQMLYYGPPSATPPPPPPPPPPVDGIPFYGNPGELSNYIKPDYSQPLGPSGLYAGDPTPTITVEWRNNTGWPLATSVANTQAGPQPGNAADFYTVRARPTAGAVGGGVWVIPGGGNVGFVDPMLVPGAQVFTSLSFIAAIMLRERSGTLILPAGFYGDRINLGSNVSGAYGFTAGTEGTAIHIAWPSWAQAHPEFGHLIVRGAVFPAGSGVNSLGLPNDGMPATFLRGGAQGDSPISANESQDIYRSPLSPPTGTAGVFIVDIRNLALGDFPVITSSKSNFWVNSNVAGTAPGAGYAPSTTFTNCLMDNGPLGGSGLRCNITTNASGAVSSAVQTGGDTQANNSIYDVGNPLELGYVHLDKITSNSADPASLRSKSIALGFTPTTITKIGMWLGDFSNYRYGAGIAGAGGNYLQFYMRNCTGMRSSNNGIGSGVEGFYDEIFARANSKFVFWDCQIHFCAGATDQHNYYIHGSPLIMIRCWGSSSGGAHNWKCECDYTLCLNSIGSCENYIGPPGVGTQGRCLNTEGPNAVYCFQSVFSLRAQSGNPFAIECTARDTQNNIMCNGKRPLIHMYQDTSRDPVTGKYTDFTMIGNGGIYADGPGTYFGPGNKARRSCWPYELTKVGKQYSFGSTTLAGKCNTLAGTGGATQTLTVVGSPVHLYGNFAPNWDISADINATDAWNMQILLSPTSGGGLPVTVHTCTATLLTLTPTWSWAINPAIPAGKFAFSNGPVWMWPNANSTFGHLPLEGPLLNPACCDPNNPRYPWAGLIRSTPDAAGLPRADPAHPMAIPLIVDTCVMFPIDTLGAANYWINCQPYIFGSSFSASVFPFPHLPLPPVKATNGEYADVAGMSSFATEASGGMQPVYPYAGVDGSGGQGIGGSDVVTNGVFALKDIMQDYSRWGGPQPTNQIFLRDGAGRNNWLSPDNIEVADVRFLQPNGVLADIPKVWQSSVSPQTGLANTKTTTAQPAGATSITVNSTTGITVGKNLSVLMTGGPYQREWYFTKVKSVVGSVVTFQDGDQLPFSSPVNANVAVSDSAGAKPAWWPDLVDWFYNNVQNRP